MRKELKPDFETAKKLYPKILEVIEEYADYFYLPSDSRRDSIQFKELKNKLYEIIGEKLSDDSIYPYDSVMRAEEYAIELGLPPPPVVKDITKEELTEIVEILSFVNPEKTVIMVNDIKFNVSSYYLHLLKKNFSSFSSDWIYYPETEYSIEDLVEKILTYKNIMYL